jgi:hypothetical protein
MSAAHNDRAIPTKPGRCMSGRIGAGDLAA